MSRNEALREARRRWGVHAEIAVEGAWLEEKPHGIILSDYELEGCTAGAHVVCCGHYDYRGRDESARCDYHWGQGDTWEAAFADADRRASQGEGTPPKAPGGNAR